MDNIQIIYPILPIVVLHFYAHVHLIANAYKAIKSREVKYRYFQVYEGDAPGYLKAARDHYKIFPNNPFSFIYYVYCCLLLRV